MSTIQNYRVNSLNQNIPAVYSRVQRVPVDFIELMESAKTLAQVQSTLSEVMNNYGLSTSGCVLAVSQENQILHFMGNARKKSLVDYYCSSCLPDKDTSIEYCAKNVTPRFWGSKSDHEFLKANKPFMADIVETFNLEYSLTIPIHAPEVVFCGFRFGSNQGDLNEKDMHRNVPTLHTISVYCYEAIVRILKFRNPPVSLSNKQITVLNWMSAGLSVCKVADRMNISENTVLYHLKNIYSALNVHTNSHAIAKAIRYKLINP